MGQPVLQLNGASQHDRVTALMKTALQLLHADDCDGAAGYCREVLRLQPGHTGALTVMVQLARQANLKNLTLQYAARLLQAAGDSAEAYELVGVAFLELGRHEAAGAALREAMRLDPDRQSVLDNYTLVLQAQGKDEERIAFLEALLAVQKNSSRLWHAYSEARHFPKGSPEVSQIRRILMKQGLDVQTRAQLQFALGKMLADGDDHVGAFRAFEAGNRLKCQCEAAHVIRWREGFWRARAAAVAAFFNHDRLAQWAAAGVPRRGLTLVVGLPRSGKTLLEQALAAHPALTAYAERAVVEEVLNRHRALKAFPQIMDGVRSEALAILGEHLDAAWGERPEEGVASHLVTTPGNIWYAGLIMSLEPSTRLVLCRREPFQNALAIYLKWFAKSHPYAWALDTIAEQIAIYDALGMHWQQCFPDRVTTVDYEEMVADPDATTERVLAAHGLEWDPACADDRAAAAQPDRVGLSGSSARRSAVDSTFSRISEVYAAQRERFDREYARGCHRVEQAWRSGGLSLPGGLYRT